MAKSPLFCFLRLRTFLFVPVKEAIQTKLSSILGSESLLKRDAFCIFDNYSFQVQSGFVKIVDLLFEPLSTVMSLVLIWQYVGVATMGAVGVILLYVPANILLARKYASFQVISFMWNNAAYYVLLQLVCWSVRKVGLI